MCIGVQIYTPCHAFSVPRRTPLGAIITAPRLFGLEFTDWTLTPLHPARVSSHRVQWTAACLITGEGGSTRCVISRCILVIRTILVWEISQVSSSTSTRTVHSTNQETIKNEQTQLTNKIMNLELGNESPKSLASGKLIPCFLYEESMSKRQHGPWSVL